MGMHALTAGVMGGWDAPFDFRLRTRVVFGDGVFSQLGALAAEFEGRRVLLVSDPGIVAAGHVARGVESLRQAGMETLVFDGASENPTTDDVERGRVLAADFRPDLLVGLGGGSSMDCAKGINFLHTNGGQMQDYWGVGKAKLPMLPMIAVPTTAGTGSEMQSFALISDSQTHVKMAWGLQGSVSRGAAGSESDVDSAGSSDGTDGSGCGIACRGDFCHAASQCHVVDFQLSRLVVADRVPSTSIARAYRSGGSWRRAIGCGFGRTGD